MTARRRSDKPIGHWLRENLERGHIRGLAWEDRAQQTFRIPWKHLGRKSCSTSDCQLFVEWAEIACLDQNDLLTKKADLSKLKTSFRKALKKANISPVSSDCTDTEEPYRVYQFNDIHGNVLASCATPDLNIPTIVESESYESEDVDRPHTTSVSADPQPTYQDDHCSSQLTEQSAGSVVDFSVGEEQTCNRVTTECQDFRGSAESGRQPTPAHASNLSHPVPSPNARRAPPPAHSTYVRQCPPPDEFIISYCLPHLAASSFPPPAHSRLLPEARFSSSSSKCSVDIDDEEAAAADNDACFDSLNSSTLWHTGVHTGIIQWSKLRMWEEELKRKEELLNSRASHLNSVEMELKAREDDLNRKAVEEEMRRRKTRQDDAKRRKKMDSVNDDFSPGSPGGLLSVSSQQPVIRISTQRQQQTDASDVRPVHDATARGRFYTSTPSYVNDIWSRDRIRILPPTANPEPGCVSPRDRVSLFDFASDAEDDARSRVRCRPTSFRYPTTVLPSVSDLSLASPGSNHADC